MVLVIINWVIKMNKKFGILIIIALLILIGIGIYVYVKNTTNESPSSYEANKTATEQNTNNANNQNSVENSSNETNTTNATNSTPTKDATTWTCRSWNKARTVLTCLLPKTRLT